MLPSLRPTRRCQRWEKASSCYSPPKDCFVTHFDRESEPSCEEISSSECHWEKSVKRPFSVSPGPALAAASERSVQSLADDSSVAQSCWSLAESISAWARLHTARKSY